MRSVLSLLNKVFLFSKLFAFRQGAKYNLISEAETVESIIALGLATQSHWVNIDLITRSTSCHLHVHTHRNISKHGVKETSDLPMHHRQCMHTLHHARRACICRNSPHGCLASTALSPLAPRLIMNPFEFLMVVCVIDLQVQWPVLQLNRNSRK